jgi:tetratricopeptide (TPR) repeat protein
LTFACAVAASLVAFVAFALIPFVGPWGAILPALVAFVATYIIVMRRINARVQLAMAGVGASIQKQKIDGALDQLHTIRAQYGRWTPFLGSQLDGQIGSIYFMKKDFEKARPFLEKSFFRSWDAKMMLAVLVSGAVDKKKKEPNLPAADAVFEAAAKHTPKQGMLWSVWAYLHYNAGNPKRALDILSRGKTALGESDPVLSANLLALQNDKKVKRKGYGDAWYALHLEAHPMMLQQQRGPQMRFARR